MAAEELEMKEKYIHRDLSWLSFNERVLEEAADANNPLLERVKFLAIFVNNLDEFQMVRVAGLKRLLDAGYNKLDAFGYYPQEVFREVQEKSAQLMKKLYDIYKNKITKELEQNKIILKSFDDLNSTERRFVKKYFETTIFSVITPMAIDQGRPFPVLPSKTLAFAVNLKRDGATNLAIVPLPKIIPRLIKLPSARDEFHFILFDEVMRHMLASFFRGYSIVEQSLFRILRDSEFTVSEEYSPDLLRTIESEIKKRSKAGIVYLEHERGASKELLELLRQGLEIVADEMTSIDGHFDLSFLFSLIGQVSNPQLCYSSYTPVKKEYDSIFDRVAEGDFILHLPYQSFSPTVDLLQSAARDENVLAIKMTLYRTDDDSAVIASLKEAAKNNKQVTVLVEIKARFDEERNINWVKELEEAGCHVMYGIADMKIHSKVMLVVRKEEGRIKRYVHLSTGNYNEKTALVYTDIGYFTANDDFAKDISDVFNVITGYSLPSRWKRIISSPYDLRQYFLELIDNEIAMHKKYKTGSIIAKMNSLEDVKIIDKLYEASNAGVSIKLMVRGICCLIPGVPGMSENIEVISIVGRFLEHSRIYSFNNNGSARIFLASADWMRRNFDRRVELCFEIYNQDIKDHIAFVLEMYSKDTMKVRILRNDKQYVRAKKSGERINAQKFFVDHYTI